MSATRDQSQKIAFVYSNLYQIYKQGTAEAASASPVPPPAPLASGYVIKAGHASVASPAPAVRGFTPAELIGARLPALGKRVARPAAISRPSVESLKQNLKSLNDLHARLKFMLAELEELTRK